MGMPRSQNVSTGDPVHVEYVFLVSDLVFNNIPYVHGAGGRHGGGRQAKLVVYARVLGVAAAVGSLYRRGVRRVSGGRSARAWMWGQWRSLGVGSRTSASTRRRLSGSGVGQANVGVGVRVATQSQRRLACARPVAGEQRDREGKYCLPKPGSFGALTPSIASTL